MRAAGLPGVSCSISQHCTRSTGMSHSHAVGHCSSKTLFRKSARIRVIGLRTELSESVASLGEGGRPLRRPWASHEEGEINEKTEIVNTILIHSANIASYVLMIFYLLLSLFI